MSPRRHEEPEVFNPLDCQLFVTSVLQSINFWFF